MTEIIRRTPDAYVDHECQDPRTRHTEQGGMGSNSSTPHPLFEHLRGARRLVDQLTGLNTLSSREPELLADTTVSDSVNILLAPFRQVLVDRLMAERDGCIRLEAVVRLPDALKAAMAIEAAFDW